MGHCSKDKREQVLAKPGLAYVVDGSDDQLQSWWKALLQSESVYFGIPFAHSQKSLRSIKELVKVEQFSVAQTFNTSAMIYKEGPNLRNVDPYNRWRTKPGEMAAEYLVRDLRNCGLFRAVISYNDSEETRYLLEGQVDEFLEVSEKDGRKAVLGLNVTFLDLTKRRHG